MFDKAWKRAGIKNRGAKWALPIMLIAQLVACSTSSEPLGSPPPDTPTTAPTATSTVEVDPTSTATLTATPTPTFTPSPSPLPDCTAGYVLYTLSKNYNDPDNGFYLACADGSFSTRVFSTLGGVPEVSSDGRFVVWKTDEPPQIQVGDLTGENSIVTLDIGYSQPFGIWSPTWSPDRDYIAHTICPRSDDEDDIQIIHLATGTRSQLHLDEQIEGIRHIEWSPDGSRIVFTNWMLELFMAEIECDESSHTCRALNVNHLTFTPDYPVEQPSWSPDGMQLIAVCVPDGFSELCVLDLVGETIQLLSVSSDLKHFNAPDWSFDGNSIAFAATPENEAGPDVFVFSLQNHSLVNLTQEPLWRNSNPVWLPPE